MEYLRYDRRILRCVSQTYFQKGFSLKAAVARCWRRTTTAGGGPPEGARLRGPGGRRDPEAGPRVRLLLRGGPRGRVRLRDARRSSRTGASSCPGEIIHNPDVNGRIERMGIRILPEAADPAARYARGRPPGDVVILPAFGVPVAEMEHLRGKGCVLVDTTCGSVLNVWKNVHQYARDGFTAVIHGKHYHEETKATASQALTHEGGQYLCVRDREEAAVVCDFIRGAGRRGRDPSSASRHAASPGFDPERDLAAHRPRQPDHDADEREPGDPGDAARGDARAPRRGGASARASAPSTPSARRPRTARTRCSRMLAEGGARPHGGDRRLQQQQHAGARPHLRRAAAHVPHPAADCIEGGRRSATGRSAATTSRERGLAARGPGAPSASPPAPRRPNNVVGEVVERMLALRGRKRRRAGRGLPLDLRGEHAPQRRLRRCSLPRRRRATVLPASASRSVSRPARPAAPAPSTRLCVVRMRRRTARASSASVTVTKPASPSRSAVERERRRCAGGEPVGERVGGRLDERPARVPGVVDRGGAFGLHAVDREPAAARARRRVAPTACEPPPTGNDERVELGRLLAASRA